MKQIVLTKSEVFRDFNKRIAAAYKHQIESQVTGVRSIIEIGKLLDEARQYRDSLNHNEGQKLWASFERRLGFSPANVSKYIAIARHPILKLKKYGRHLPPSVFSLYELSKLDALDLQALLKQKTVTPTLGRSDIIRLSKAKKTPKKSKQIELFRICVDEGDLIAAYEQKYTLVADILKKLDIDFQDAPQVARLKRAQTNYNKKIEQFLLKSAKNFLKQSYKRYVEHQGIALNAWNSRSKLSYMAKLKKIGIRQDEISTEFCTSTDEIKDIYINGPFDGIDAWHREYMGWYHAAQEAVRMPKILQSRETPVESVELEPLVTFGKKRRTVDFTGVKI